MTAYTGIQGQNILIVSSDPANPVEGQIWYNSTSNLLKGSVAAVSTWASSGAMNTTGLGGATAATNAPQTASVAFGGYINFGSIVHKQKNIMVLLGLHLEH